MNLYELIQSIPVFVQSVISESKELEKKQQQDQKEVQETEEAKQELLISSRSSYGRFHLGRNYDLNIWLSNTNTTVFPSTIEDDQDIRVQFPSSKLIEVSGTSKSVFIVVSDQAFLLLEPD